MNALSEWPRNRLLLGLPSRDLRRLMPHLEHVPCHHSRSGALINSRVGNRNRKRGTISGVMIGSVNRAQESCPRRPARRRSVAEFARYFLLWRAFVPLARCHFQVCMQPTWNKTEPFGFISEREQRHAALFLPSQLWPTRRAGRRRRRVAEPIGRPRRGVGGRPRAGQSRGRGQSAALGGLVRRSGGRNGRFLPHADRSARAWDIDAGLPCAWRLGA